MKLSYSLLLLLVILLPTQLGYHFWPNFAFVYGLKIDYLSPTLFLTDLALFLFLFTFFIEEKVFVNLSRLLVSFQDKVSFFSFILILTLVTVGAPFPLLSLFKALRFLFLFIFVLVLKNGNFKFKKIIFALSIACFYSCLLAIGQVISQSSLNGPFWLLGERNLSLSTPGIAKAIIDGRLFLRPYGSFSHPNSMAGFLLASFFLIFFELKKERRTPLSQWYRLLLSLILITLFLTFSRVSWLVLFLLLPFGLFCFYRKGKTTTKMNLPGLSLKVFSFARKIKKLFYLAPLILFPFVGFYFLKNLPFSTSLSLSQRLALNKIAIVIFRQHPLFGVGLNGFLQVLPSFWQTGKIFLLQPVHNIYLLVLAETGILGGLFLFSLLFVLIRKLVKEKRLSILLSLLTILSTGLFDHYWLTLVQNQLLLVLVLGFGFKNQGSDRI